MHYQVNKYKLILDYIQYKFPLTPTPYTDIAAELGIEPGQLINTLKRLSIDGVIKRVGFTINYRSSGHTSALVAFNIKEDYIPLYAEELRRNPMVKHNYIRRHPNYNAWFTIRGKSNKEIVRQVMEIASKFKVEDYIILRSVKTYKLRVKYSLDRGISWSEPRPGKQAVRDLSYYGLNHNAVKILRKLPLKLEPYKEISGKIGIEPEELISILREMERDGTILDYGGVLDGEKIGFKYNCMVVFEGDDGTCMELLRKAYEATHIVLRESIYGEWGLNTYFMIHGVEKEGLEARIAEIMDDLGVDSYQKIYSIRRLKD